MRDLQAHSEEQRAVACCSSLTIDSFVEIRALEFGLDSGDDGDGLVVELFVLEAHGRGILAWDSSSCGSSGRRGIAAGGGHRDRPCRSRRRRRRAVLVLRDVHDAAATIRVRNRTARDDLGRLRLVLALLVRQARFRLLLVGVGTGRFFFVSSTAMTEFLFFRRTCMTVSEVLRKVPSIPDTSIAFTNMRVRRNGIFSGYFSR